LITIKEFSFNSILVYFVEHSPEPEIK